MSIILHCVHVLFSLIAFTEAFLLQACLYLEPFLVAGLYPEAFLVTGLYLEAFLVGEGVTIVNLDLSQDSSQPVYER